MSRTDVINTLAISTALVLATVGVLVQSRPVLSVVSDPVGKEEALATIDAPSILEDARSAKVPAAPYKSIISLNTVADHVLIRMLEPGRLIGVATYTKEKHPEGWKFAACAGIDKSESLEQILSMQPDLVVASKFTSDPIVARLREHNIQVFDLGEMRGVLTTRKNIRTLGHLLQLDDRANRLLEEFNRQLAALDHAIDERDEVPGIYLTAIGDSFFGGTSGSSYSDLLRLAGLHDLAADAGYKDWPKYSTEQLLSLNPPNIVTQGHMRTAICGHSELSKLKACAKDGRVIEIHGTYHSDPGLGLVHAAQLVQDEVHGRSANVDPVDGP